MDGLSGLNTWRAEISKHRIAYALLAAFVATHFATVSGYWYKIIGIPVLGWPQFNGILLLGHTGSSTDGAQQFWAGSVYHFLTGICYSLIFVFLIHPLIPIKNTVLGNLVKALLYGVVLATLSAAVWVSSNFPEFHPGEFSQNLPGGWKVVLGIYIWHLVYGLNLGLFWNPLPNSKEAAQPA
jgi:hypothetical protein